MWTLRRMTARLTQALLLALSACAGAFRVAPRALRLHSHASPAAAARRPSAVVATATEMKPTARSAEPARAMMDGGVFTFNKVVIDTVYEVICLLYPVKGNARDFARFYVLETVARVPYFAYLSVRCASLCALTARRLARST